MVVLTLLLCMKESRILDRIILPDGNPVKTLPDKNTANGSASPSSSEKDYLNMTLEELMQIPIASIASWNNSSNFLDMSIQELMNIPVTAVPAEQQQHI